MRPGTSARDAGGADHQERDREQREQHEQRRIRERDLGAADVEDREEFLDLELMNGIHDRIDPQLAARRAVRAAVLIASNPADPACWSRTTPATRITLRTPAAKPSSRNTIIPHGEIPSHLSRSQPMPAPTRTPATSSVDNRKPRAIAEASAVDRGPGSLSEGRPGRNSPSRSPRRCNRAESAASSGGGCPRSPLSRASSAMLRHPRRFRQIAAVPPPPRRADHTDWVQVSQELCLADKSLKTNLNRLDGGRRRRSILAPRWRRFGQALRLAAASAMAAVLQRAGGW